MLRSLGLMGAVLAAPPLLSGCAKGAPTRQGAGPGLAMADLARSPGSTEALPSAVAAVQAFTADLYRSLAAQAGNVICSPYSVAVALAMTRNGARGQTASEMDDVLHSPGLGRLNAGLDELTRLVDSRAGTQRADDNSLATISLDVASSLWGQQDFTWEPAFLARLARSYGAGIRLVDYEKDTEAARALINQWTAGQTNDRIPEILPEGVLDSLTRLVLVNAIYLKAQWEVPFQTGQTRQRPFTLSDNSRVTTPTMSAYFSEGWYGRGPGWQVARLPYVGGQLAMTVVLPTTSLAVLEKSLDGATLTRLLTAGRRVPSLGLELPRWKTSLSSSLKEPLVALGMPTAFDVRRADFSLMTTDEDLYIGAVVHDAFVSVDEKGTEAAAATAVVVEAGSMPVQPVVLHVNRPFLFIIHDVPSATPLFIGRVSDPTVAA